MWPGRVDWRNVHLRRDDGDIDNRGVHVYETQRTMDGDQQVVSVVATDRNGAPLGELDVVRFEKPERSVWLVTGADGSLWTVTAGGCCGGG